MGDSEKIRLLLVDDDSSMRELLEYILHGETLELSFADCGQEAISILEATPYDVVVSDIRMPDGDGFFLLQEIRNRWPKIRVILISGYADKGAVDAFRSKVGDFPYLPKIECPARLGAMIRSGNSDGAD